MTLGEKIKHLRNEHNMTQDDLARVCYVTRNAVSKWENNNGNPNLESIRLICDYFDLTIDEFLNEDLHIEEIVKYSNYIIKNETKIAKKITIILEIIMIILYPTIQLLLREIIYNIDPTATLSWGYIFAPFMAMIYGILISLIFKKCDNALLSGLIGYLLTVIIDNIISFPNLIDLLPLHTIYFLCFLIICIIAYCIKYQRFIIKDLKLILLIKKSLQHPKRKIIISIILLSVTLISFLIEITIAIYLQKYHQEHIIFGLFNRGPLFFVIVFSIPILLEMLFVVSSIKSYKQNIEK